MCVCACLCVCDMYVCVCVCVSVFVCVCVFAHLLLQVVRKQLDYSPSCPSLVYVYEYLCSCNYLFIHVCVCVICVCVCVCVYIRPPPSQVVRKPLAADSAEFGDAPKHAPSTRTFKHVCICTHMCIYMCVCLCLCVFGMCVCVWVCVSACELSVPCACVLVSPLYYKPSVCLCAHPFLQVVRKQLAADSAEFGDAPKHAPSTRTFKHEASAAAPTKPTKPKSAAALKPRCGAEPDGKFTHI